MADNAKVSQISSGGATITIIDPNPPGSKIIPTEDLFIYVSLRIRPKNRSVLEVVDQGKSIDSSDGVVINLIGTQVDSKNNEYMSTDWTNIGGNINGNVTGTKNKESFGIKNINITYGADLLPRVSITFLDVRGASMFDGFEHIDKNGVKSNVSTYSSFFTMPYPIFELTVKGYYGKAVKYCLNMTKWSGNFNGGNFEIKAEFIGYNTSFLSDIIMDHVRAVVDTDDGYSELINVYNKNSKGKPPITINQLLENVGNIDKYVTDIKSNDNNKGDEVGYKTLVELNTSLSKLSVIKTKVGDPIGVNNQDNPNYFNLEGPYIKYNGLTPRLNIFAFRDIQLITEDAVNKYYIKFRKDLISTIKTYEKELPGGFSDYAITKKSGKSLEEFIPNTNTSETAYSLVPKINNILINGDRKDVGYSKSEDFLKPPYSFTATTINNGLGPETKSQYFDYFYVRKVVNDLYESLSNKRQEVADKVSENINKYIDKKITFNPSIGNIFEVLCNNIEAYLNVVYKTAFNAETKNDNRVSIIKGKITDTIKDRIYAWPMLYKDNGDEIYLGEDIKISENEQYFPEIKYIENLATSLVKENKKNNNPSLDNKNVTFPINPGDINHYYNAYSVTNFAAPQKTSLINRIITRALITYGYSNFKDKMNDFANMEAAALYELTVDPVTKNAIASFLSEGATSLLLRSEQSQFITKSGNTYYANDNLTLNEEYKDIASFITGSTTLFFDIGITADEVTKKLFNQPNNDLFFKVKTSLGDNKDVVQYFTPTNTDTSKFNTTYYSVEENIVSSCWQEAVLDADKKTIVNKLKEYVGNVKSEYSEKNYSLNQSISYNSFTSTTLTTLSLNSNIISVDQMKGMLILATYPFKPLNEFLSKLKDKSKVVDIPYSYMAWIGAHMKRQEIFDTYGYDILDIWANLVNNEFTSEQVKGVNNYINISNKIKTSGELPPPFNNFKLFNNSIDSKFINVFDQWVKDIKNCGLIEFFNKPTFDATEFDKILMSTEYNKTNNSYPLVSYTPNFWNLKDDKNFKIDESVINNFLNIFSQKFSTLNQNTPKTKPNNMTPRTVVDNNLKQSMYKTTKNLYDKWIGGTINGKTYNACGGYDADVNKSIFSYFRFIDKDYSDISDIARIDLNSLLVMSNSTNVNFLEVVSRLLRDNNFLFLPLPVYIDYSKRADVDSIFTPYTFIKETIGGPSFIAMYNSGNSKYLDLGKNYQHINDSYDFVDNGGLPSSLTSSNNGTKSVVAFRVAFGDENQSIFKNITINQEDFTETEESLRATSDLIDRKGGTQRTFKGTNLYNVYSLRSYNVNFEMMGNAMIQPLMYLQLDNIPMFHGAYSVINVSHDISPNTMNTRVKAVRKSKYSVPIVTNSTTYLPLDLNKNLNITTNLSVVSASDIVNDVIEDNTLSGYKRPIEGNIIISSKKGLRWGKLHQGVDISIKENTPLLASWSGIVGRYRNSKGYGLYVIIDHSNGTDKPFDDGYFYYTLYGHLNEVDIQDGTQVKSGQPFAKSGGIKGGVNSGNSQGEHLHYEIRRSATKLVNVKDGYFGLLNKNVLDPATFINYKFAGVDSKDGDQDHDQLPPFGGTGNA